MKAAFALLLLAAAASGASASSPSSSLFRILAEDTSDVMLCKADGLKSCKKIEVNYGAVAEDRIRVGEYEYVKKHSINKKDHVLYGYEASPIQGDTSGCSQGSVDIKTKVPFLSMKSL